MAAWFAQNSGVNIDSVNQWNSAANGSGSWLTWASLGASDVLVANGKTSITINVPVVCGELTTIANGGTAGGGFIWPGGVAITANLKPGFSQLLTTSGSGSRVITGNVFGSTLNAAAYALASTADAVTIVGNVTGGSGNLCRTLNNCSNVTVVGNVTGGVSHADSAALHSDGGGSVFVTGTVTAGVTSPAITSYTTITVVGTIQTSTTNVHAIASGTTTTLIHNGNLISAPSGTVPLRATTLNVLIDPSTTITHTYRVNNSGSAGAARSLYTGGVNLGQPTAADVRSGTAFGASSEYTGTLAVPSPTLVAIGVPTDNTVGSYSPSVNASDIRTAVGLATANLDTQLSGIQADTNDIQTRLPAALESGRIAAALDAVSIEDIADQVWDEAYADHNSAGSFGKLLNTIRKANLAIEGEITNTVAPTASAFTSNVSATTGAYEHAVLLFTSGPLTGENSPILTYTSTNGAIVLEEALTAAPTAADEFVIIAGSHVHSVASIKSGLSTLTSADVNDQVLDVLTTDTFNELSAPPAASSSLKDKLTWLFMWSRNKSTQSATERKLYADDTTTVVSTEGVSDNGTVYTKDEAV